MAGEANIGTLRYLLADPVQRTRLLAVKYTAVLIFTVFAVLLVAVVGVGLGLALFGAGPVTLLSGTQVSTGVGLWRLLLVCGYLVVCLAAFGAIGLFVSTLTEQPSAPPSPSSALAVISQILGFGDAARRRSTRTCRRTTGWPSVTCCATRSPPTRSAPGIVSAVVYTAIFLTAAWARFGSKDITS